MIENLQLRNAELIDAANMESSEDDASIDTRDAEESTELTSLRARLRSLAKLTRVLSDDLVEVCSTCACEHCRLCFE